MVFLLLFPALLAMLLAKVWYLAAVPLTWGLVLNRRHHRGDPPWRHPLVQVTLAWLLVASPALWPGRALGTSPWFGDLGVPAYTCLDMLLIATGFVWFAISFLRAWGHRAQAKRNRKTGPSGPGRP